MISTVMALQASKGAGVQKFQSVVQKHVQARDP